MITRIIVIGLLSCITIFAQNIRTVSRAFINQTGAIESVKDTINIKDIVSAQIEAAKKNAEKRETPAGSITEVKTLQAGSNSVFIKYLPKLSEGMLIKVIILSLACFVASVFIFIRRRKLKKDRAPAKDEFKKRISLIREEKLIKVENRDLKKVRKKLLRKSKNVLSDENIISTKAKELNISKGEIILAQRIKSHKLAKAAGN